MADLFVSYTAICKVPGTEGVRVFDNHVEQNYSINRKVYLHQLETFINGDEPNLTHVRILFWRRMGAPEEGSDAPD